MLIKEILDWDQLNQQIPGSLRSKRASTPKPQPAPTKQQVKLALAPLKQMTQRQGFRPPDHEGVDLVAAENTALYAPQSGRLVSGKGWNGGMGTYIKLNSQTGEHRFMHLSRVAVNDGPVKQGQLIGYTGNTGNSTGPHLHWEYRDHKQGLIDPMTLLR